MVDFRLLILAVALATVAYLWNSSTRLPVPVITTIEPAYDYIIGKHGRLFAVDRYYSAVLSIVDCIVQ